MIVRKLKYFQASLKLLIVSIKYSGFESFDFMQFLWQCGNDLLVCLI